MHPSPSVQTPALRTVGNIVTGDDLQTQIIINFSALPCLLALLGNPKKGIRKEACWTISNITAGNKDQIQSVVDANIVPPLVNLLNSAEFDIRKEAAWAISNATSGGTPIQIKSASARENNFRGRAPSRDAPNVAAPPRPRLPRTLRPLRADSRRRGRGAAATPSPRTRDVAAAASPRPRLRGLSALSAEYPRRGRGVAAIRQRDTERSRPRARRFLVSQVCIPPLCELLSVADVKIIIVALEALENILKVGDAEAKTTPGGHNVMANHIADSEGLKKIEDLQQHDNNDIYEKAVRILETYFGVDEEDVNIAPEAVGSAYAFGQVQSTPQQAFDFGQPGV